MLLSNDYRHPALLAHEATTLHAISGGRFELGLGAGRYQPGTRRSARPLAAQLMPWQGLSMARLAARAGERSHPHADGRASRPDSGMVGGPSALVLAMRAFARVDVRAR